MQLESVARVAPMRQSGLGHELSSWVRYVRVASHQGQELLNNRSRGQCWEPLPGSA